MLSLYCTALALSFISKNEEYNPEKNTPNFILQKVVKQ